MGTWVQLKADRVRLKADRVRLKPDPTYPLIAPAQQKNDEQERRRDSEEPHKNVANRTGLIAGHDTLGQALHRLLPSFLRANEVPRIVSQRWDA